MRKKSNRFKLAISLVIFVFLTILASFLIIAIVFFLIVHTRLIEYFPIENHEKDFWGPLFLVLFISVSVGTMMTVLFNRLTLKPYSKAIEAINEVANGNFNVHLDFQHGPEELIELSNSFNRMTKELNGTETLRTDFMNHFSHEFKTPIVSIQGFARLMKNPELSEDDRQKYVDIILSESGRLTKLSNSVLILSKVENTEIISEKTTFSLDEQLRRVILLLEPKWTERGISFDLDLSEGTIYSDDELLQQLWINLIDNGIKFSEEQSTITITMRNYTHLIEVTISDQGIGMDQETLHHLFDKFYQGDRSHASEGNGLGLALVKKIVELSGATIEVDSELGLGTIFRLRFPKDAFTKN